jgi:serine/threonine protein phosphatase 1
MEPWGGVLPRKLPDTEARPTGAAADGAAPPHGSILAQAIGRVFGSRGAEDHVRQHPTFAVPEGVRVYAVGDIHGHLDLLERMQGLIDEDFAAHPAGRAIEVYLGDYVDRGPASAGVVEALGGPPPDGLERVCLIGNHEEFLLQFLDEPLILQNWLDNGGHATLASYGVAAASLGAEPNEVAAALREALPEHHLRFFNDLALGHRIGDVLFVHAGIRPGVPIEAQDPHDLMWIRTPFLGHDGPLPVRVVHGHTPVRAPVVTPYRIGIDTGAFATGVLTCAVLEGPDVRFLST